MNLDHPLIKKLGGLGIVALTRQWMGALDYQAMFYVPFVDPVHPQFGGPMIYVFWHEYMLSPFYLRPHCRIAMLLSRHRDAQWLAHAAQYMGFETVRGSVRRGGVSALLQLMRKGRLSNLAIACDGPLGPRRTMAPGVAYLASRLGAPLVALGFGYDRPWRAPTWDRFALPRPGSRVRAVVGPPLRIARDFNRDQLKSFNHRIEDLLNWLTTEAENWARSGNRLPDQTPLRPQASIWRPKLSQIPPHYKRRSPPTKQAA